MAFNYYVPKYSKSQMRFKPHYNHAMGKKYYTKADYLSDMKRNGLEPYDPSKVKEVKHHEYKPSDKARTMINSLSKDKNGKYIVGDRYRDELNKMKGDTKSKARDLKGKLTDELGRTRLNNMEGGFLDA